MPLRRYSAPTGTTVTYRVYNDETGAEVTTDPVSAVAGASGGGFTEYTTATSIPAGQSAKWYEGGVWWATDDPLGATPTDITNATTTITDAITDKPVTPATDLTGLEAAIAAAAAQLYAAGAGSVTLGTPITTEALVERGTDAVLTFDADTTGRTATLTLYPQGSTTAALTVAGVAAGAVTTVSLTDTQTLALNGVFRMVLDSTLGSDTVRHIDGLLVAT